MERYQREAKEKALLTSHGRKWEEKKTQDQQQQGCSTGLYSSQMIWKYLRLKS